MRPEIEGSLESRVKRVYKQAGYGTASELVRDAVRNHLNQIEAQGYTDGPVGRPLFRYRIYPSEEYPTEIRLLPKEDSLTFESFEHGEPPHTVVFDTGVSYVGADAIKDGLREINGVEYVQVPVQTGAIRIYVTADEAPEGEYEQLVNRVYETLVYLFAVADKQVENDAVTRQESYQQAVAPYWDATGSRSE